jgi:hypothetical protein
MASTYSFSARERHLPRSADRGLRLVPFIVFSFVGDLELPADRRLEQITLA